jgi:hypothetical protein
MKLPDPKDIDFKSDRIEKEKLEKENEALTFKTAYLHYYTVSRKLVRINQRLEQDNTKLAKLVAIFKKRQEHEQIHSKEKLNAIASKYELQIRKVNQDSIAKEVAYKAKVGILEKEIERMHQVITLLKNREKAIKENMKNYVEKL